MEIFAHGWFTSAYCNTRFQLALNRTLPSKRILHHDAGAGLRYQIRANQMQLINSRPMQMQLPQLRLLWNLNQMT
jgi:hypothetical protein